MLGCQGIHWVESSKKMLTQISLVLACLGNVRYAIVCCTVYRIVKITKQYKEQFSVQYRYEGCPCTQLVETN